MPDHQGYYRGTSLGVCAECGRTKRYSNSYWKNNRRWERAQRGLGPAAVAPTRRRVTALGTDLDWNLLLDALVTTSAGTANELRRLTQQFDPSARFFHEVATTLSDLGHIEVTRDPYTAEMTHWETAPTAVIAVDGEWVLAGHWPRDYVADLEEHGVQVRRESQEGAPDRVTTTASRELIAEVIPEALISEDAALALAGALPTLSAVIEALPRVPMPGVVTLDRYEPARDVWQTVTSAQVPGSYRTGGYSRTYVVRTAQDVADGTARVVTVGLAKHAVAIAQSGSRPLLAYDPARKTLTVPLGARLPEMYSRAATLASGRAPQRWDDGEYGSFMAYRDVPEGVARLIHHAMGA